MNKFNWVSLFLLITFLNIFANPAHSHVVPEDELRNQVYLTPKAALKKVFEGSRKIKREKRKLSYAEIDQIERICGQHIKDRRMVLYIADSNSEKTYAVMTKAFANSHPVTEAHLILLIDSEGRVKDIHIMEYRGPQRAEIISRAFLDQYLGKSAETDFSIITSNQGPTPSVRALCQAVHQILAAFQVLYLNSET